MSYWRLMKAAERGITLARIFNLREGFSEKDDLLPKRMSTPQPEGNLKGVTVDPSAFSDAKQLYYQMLGWSDRGIPTKGRLAELGLEWASRYLEPVREPNDDDRPHSLICPPCEGDSVV